MSKPDLAPLQREVLRAFFARERDDRRPRPPATLAWILSQVTIPSDATLPGGVDPRALDDYVRDLVTRLRKLARP